MALFSDKKPFPAATELEIDGRPVRIGVRVSPRARAYRLSLPHAGGPVLTVPVHGRWREAQAFLERQRAWLAERLRHAARPVAFADGAVVPLRGVDHAITATGSLRGRIEAVDAMGGPRLLVPGEAAHHARRLTDWFKAEARADLAERCAIHARRLDVEVKSLAMRSQATRWGSCSSSGRLNFNWRLVLAPPFVLDYVAAHEVAHLREMNHSAAFWAQVAKTLPDMERGRAWLKANGRQLMLYGQDA